MTDKEKLAAALADLQAFLGDRATDAPLHRMAYSRDWSPRFKDMTDLPDLVVVPHNTDEVVRIVRVALQYELPVIPLPAALAWGWGGRLERWHHGRNQRHEPGAGDRS